MSLLLIWFWINSNRESHPPLLSPLSPSSCPNKHTPTRLISRSCSLSDLSLIAPLVPPLLLPRPLHRIFTAHGEHLHRGCLDLSVLMTASHFSETMPPALFLSTPSILTASLCLWQHSQLLESVAWYEHMHFIAVLLSVSQGLKGGNELAASVQPAGAVLALLGRSWSNQPGQGWKVALGHEVGGKNGQMWLLFC